MRNNLIYDLPTRIFHWLFAGLFLTSFLIAKTSGDDSPWFSFHSLGGLTLGFLIALRVIWGVLGSKHARFSGFALNPKDLIQYFRDIVTGKKKVWAGHNPASSWATLLMLALGAGLAITGYLMTSGPDKEVYEDVHELMANGFMVVVILHVAGVILHSLRHRDMIALSMVDGRKAGVSAQQSISSAKTPWGIFLLGLVTVFALNLYKNYDAQTGVLQFFGTPLQLNESEEEETQEGNTKAVEGQSKEDNEHAEGNREHEKSTDKGHDKNETEDDNAGDGD